MIRNSADSESAIVCLLCDLQPVKSMISKVKIKRMIFFMAQSLTIRLFKTGVSNSSFINIVPGNPEHLNYHHTILNIGL